MAERALVLSADPWAMTDEKSGERIAGNSLWYVNSYRDGDLGQKPTKVNASDAICNELKSKLPAVVEMEYGSRPGAGGKAALTVVGVKLIKQIDFSLLFKESGKEAARA